MIERKNREKLALISIIAVIWLMQFYTASASYVAAQLQYGTSTMMSNPSGNASIFDILIGTGVRPFQSVKYAVLFNTAFMYTNINYYECLDNPTSHDDLSVKIGSGNCTNLLYLQDYATTSQGLIRAVGTTTTITPNLLKYGVLSISPYYTIKLYGATTTEFTTYLFHSFTNSTSTNYMTPYFELVNTYENGWTSASLAYSSNQIICNTLDVGCYFSNALSWALSPSQSSFERFTTLKEEIKGHAPFGYFSSAYDAVMGFNASSTSYFTLASSTPINTYIFTPLRTGINWLFIFAGLYWLYKRLTDINI
jgi:hypothetical protein